MEHFLLDDPNTYRVFSAFMLLTLIAAWVLIAGQLRDGLDMQLSWKAASLLFVSALLIPVGIRLSLKAYALSPGPEVLTLDFVGPVPSKSLPYTELEKLWIVRHYTLGSGERITGSTWSVRLVTRGRVFATLETPDLRQILVLRQHLQDKAAPKPEYRRTFGRMFDPMPSSELEVISEETVVDRLPDDLTLPLAYRIVKIWQWIPI